MNNEKLVVKTDGDKSVLKVKRQLSKTNKIIISVIAVILVLLTATVGVLTGMSNATKSKYFTKIVLALAPESYYEDSVTTRFYIKENPDYDAKTDTNPLNAFTFYYNDPITNEEVDLIDGIYFNEEKGQSNVFIGLGFLSLALQPIANAKLIMEKVLIVFIILVVLFGIFLWFKAWSKRQDKMKKEIYGNMPNSNKKKKKNKK